MGNNQGNRKGANQDKREHANQVQKGHSKDSKNNQQPRQVPKEKGGGRGGADPESGTTPP